LGCDLERAVLPLFGCDLEQAVLSLFGCDLEQAVLSLYDCDLKFMFEMPATSSFDWHFDLPILRR